MSGPGPWAQGPAGILKSSDWHVGKFVDGGTKVRLLGLPWALAFGPGPWPLGVLGPGLRGAQGPGPAFIVDVRNHVLLLG